MFVKVGKTEETTEERRRRYYLYTKINHFKDKWKPKD